MKNNLLTLINKTMSREFGGPSPEEMGMPKITNEVITPLHGQELDQVRYQELAKDLLGNEKTKKAEILFQWRPTMDKDFNRETDMIKASMELGEDGILALSTDNWQASIAPDGKITGEIPQKLIEFLTYDKKEYDEELGGKKEHRVDYIKQEFGEGGQFMSTSFKYEK